MEKPQDLLMRIVENDFDYAETHFHVANSHRLWNQQRQRQPSDDEISTVCRIDAVEEHFAKVLTDWHQRVACSQVPYRCSPPVRLLFPTIVPFQASDADQCVDVVPSGAETLPSRDEPTKPPSPGRPEYATETAEPRSTDPSEPSRTDHAGTAKPKNKRRKKRTARRRDQDEPRRLPVLRAGDVESLLRQFEASEDAFPVSSTRPPVKSDQTRRCVRPISNFRQRVGRAPPEPLLRETKVTRDSPRSSVRSRIEIQLFKRFLVQLFESNRNHVETGFATLPTSTYIYIYRRVLSRQVTCDDVLPENEIVDGGLVRLDHDYCTVHSSSVGSGRTSRANVFETTIDVCLLVPSHSGPTTTTTTGNRDASRCYRPVHERPTHARPGDKDVRQTSDIEEHERGKSSTRRRFQRWFRPSRRERNRSDNGGTNSPLQPMTLVYVHHASTTTEPVQDDPENLIWSEREIVSVLKPKLDGNVRPRPVTRDAVVQTYETAFEFPTRSLIDVDERFQRRRSDDARGRDAESREKRAIGSRSNRSESRGKSKSKSRSRSKSSGKRGNARRRRISRRRSSVSSSGSWSSSRSNFARTDRWASKGPRRPSGRRRTTYDGRQRRSTGRYRSYGDWKRSPSSTSSYRRSYDDWYDREKRKRVEERRVIYVGRLDEGITKADLRARFETFGPVVDINGVASSSFNDGYVSRDGQDNTFDLLLKEAKAKLRRRNV
ncbi:unnamed protein product [Heterotrigona itama]|uniref:RRM domain-containing protein n=1 Tax=Heterotrigona itama TaxID=395501 RepID=A0A6V7GVV5_9HYME|nr:unnamed protein product [Heterotrigona itama]